MIITFNALSLLFGGVAVVTPVVALLVKKCGKHKAAGVSLSACATALFCQIAQFNSRVAGQGFSALLDTSPYVTRASALFLITVLLLNLAVFCKNKK